MTDERHDLKMPFTMAPNAACCGKPAAGEAQPCDCQSAPPSVPCDCQGPADEVCCGKPPGPPSSPLERPGFQMCRFVVGFRDTPAGPVPEVKTHLSAADRLGTLLTRLNVNRLDYKIAPGLYCVGSPDADAPVLVTANYKLTFDALRKELAGISLWILVLDTRGINVWCAAGKALFSTGEVNRMVEQSGLASVVAHRMLILPQLAATGVSAQAVKIDCGFRVVWGPVKASDLKAFFQNGSKADDRMREVTFSLGERLVLIPVELSAVIRPSIWILLAAFVLSGIGTGIFSPAAAWHRGLWLALAHFTGILAGSVAVPALLPIIPGRAFAVKGALAGFVAGSLLLVAARQHLTAWELAAVLLVTAATSSFLAMNFTGATPFTSPSGVETEMRHAIPWQGLAVVLIIFIWVGAGLTG